ncbi:MAG: tail fiber domain-containing protein [Polyangiaceae bacterium]|jgi:hypothetical protein
MKQRKAPFVATVSAFALLMLLAVSRNAQATNCSGGSGFCLSYDNTNSSGSGGAISGTAGGGGGSGVEGNSTDAWGVYGTSTGTTNSGIYEGDAGASGVGVLGSSGNGVGVMGSSTNGPGVVGYSDGVWPAAAVYGDNPNANGNAIVGIADGANGWGAYMEGSNMGLQAYGFGTGGYGVQGVASGSGGQAVSGICNSSCATAGGYAGYFTGNVYTTGNLSVASFTNRSDLRLKKDVENAPYGLRELLQLRPVAYHWKDPASDQGKQVGVIAQEVQKVLPELVQADPVSGMLSVNYLALIPVTIGAVQEQNRIIEAQRKLIEQQMVRISRLERGHAPTISYLVPGGLGALACGLVPVGFFVAWRRRTEQDN